MADDNRQIFVSLGGFQDLEYKLPNEITRDGTPQKHRKALTGTDRHGAAGRLSVVGYMPTYVHGHSSDGTPHTLAIFEWKAISERPGLRFKNVEISMTFKAVGPRGEAEEEAASRRRQGFPDNFWDPEVVRAVPYGESWYDRTLIKTSGKSTLEVGFSAGFAPYFSAGPKYVLESSQAVDRTDAVKVVGKDFVDGRGRSRSNGVRWTTLENKSQKSGVPAYLRTAVLLKRERGDTGMFVGNVSVVTNVSWWENLVENGRRLTGAVEKDDPVIFDPAEEPKVTTSFDTMREKLEQVPLDDEFKLVSLQPLAPANADAEAEEANMEE